jgi:hypothetical protein
MFRGTRVDITYVREQGRVSYRQTTNDLNDFMVCGSDFLKMIGW